MSHCPYRAIISKFSEFIPGVEGLVLPALRNLNLGFKLINCGPRHLVNALEFWMQFLLKDWGVGLTRILLLIASNRPVRQRHNAAKCVLQLKIA